MKSPIEDEWKKFEAAVQPGDPGSIQRIETRKAFFAGASIMFHVMVDTVGELSEEEAEKYMQSISEEIDRYGQELKRAQERYERMQRSQRN